MFKFHLKPITIIFLILFLNPLITLSQETTTRNCRADLSNDINTIINRPIFRRSRWGILVETLSSKNRIYDQDSQHYFIPASTAKLLTTAAVLQKLRPQLRIRTSIYGDNNRNIYVVGRGDPSLTETELKKLAEQLKQQGITTINQLIADNSYFQGTAINPNWEWEDIQAGYGAPINSLILNQNSIDLVLSPQGLGQPLKVTFIDPIQSNKWQIDNNSVTVATHEKEFVEVGRSFTQPIIRISGQLKVGSVSEPVYVSVVEPVDNFLNKFRQVLESEGIRVSRIVEQSPTTSNLNLTELAFVESPTVGELIEEVNKESNNVYAEALLRQLGARSDSVSNHSSNNDTLEKSLEEVRAILARLGVPANSFRLNDGSGLSRHNLVSPEALVQSLRIMANSPWADLYQNSLPIAGVSGTLSWRFRNSLAEGNVQAKTGALSGVVSLAGYIQPPDFEPLVFSIIVNQSDLKTQEVRTAIDEIVLLLTQLKYCG
ncbi:MULTISPECIES: D-alanyl-D-alanine carboxypeptidase/D-alanyl-D-alanine-endopeptidase [unclassified Roseofilum]|uniref:D-alanyl-D-alanine carboxypeptidase/D-alanyl-D-alanine endopeptidase n=1 Tax=unclassified Roseofilum TaxID=2620099 RepID=UPI000E9D0E58|nr:MULTISPECIES: D-alanyl-D-alanine carboxypeptidase/D-alanyl-D-alanine-endopeptidase [unclassified Roseofilum]MBP0010652.1 D-alanyl-D-alanine carboxypeptidase/D-alanyl-D-alanine-endopeptidase [Roseofilum sp. Belize Diploria]MBP0034780.1 D-alanyl-D-alanine carboxypeptidase/D-alanyl-D-alanine-endopeptidase [Roseofilum sp. Belize BBD 4]HBR00698.1 D-alanyl-D-alanine carboxypeptidase/D-alanyl-D-alanine-endopeptidase [Cyanobacteria bacterium UBA11691]